MSEPVSTEIKTRKDPKAALSTSHCAHTARDNTALTFSFNWVQIKQHSFSVPQGAWRTADGEAQGETLSSRIKQVLILTQLYCVTFCFSEIPRSFLERGRHHFDLNMIFIFHDNGDGDDDNAVCIVMIIWVPGVSGRVCVGMLHWCPPCWLWTFSCPLMSSWLMGRVFSDTFSARSVCFVSILCLLFGSNISSKASRFLMSERCLLVPFCIFFLWMRIINLSVRLSPIFSNLPAVSLCLLSFIRGSHQTLSPDWFSCEQGCSGGGKRDLFPQTLKIIPIMSTAFLTTPHPTLQQTPPFPCPLLCPGVKKNHR